LLIKIDTITTDLSNRNKIIIKISKFNINDNIESNYTQQYDEKNEKNAIMGISDPNFEAKL